MTHIDRRMSSLGRFAALLILGCLAAAAHAGEAWAMTGSMNMPRFGHAAIRLADGKVLVMGGFDTRSGRLSSCELYDPVAGTWSLTGSMLAPHDGTDHPYPVVRLADGRILTIGGSSDPSECELYDPATGRWSSAASLPDQRTETVAVVLPSGLVLVAGGYDWPSITSLATSYLYHPADDAWVATGPLITSRYLTSMNRLVDGRVIIIGGSYVDHGTGQVLSACESFDGSAWSQLAPMAGFRDSHSSIVMADGRVLVTGGAGWGMLQTTEIYQPSTNRWSTGGSLSTIRMEMSLVLLPDGRVMALDGGPWSYAPTGYATTEVCDPATGTWSAGPTLHAVRHFASSTVLTSGQVLVAGGRLDNQFTAYASAELLVATPVLTVTAPLNAVVGTPVSYQILANNAPTAYAASGLPAGLSVDATTGLISGVPTAAGSTIATLSASNLAGSGSASLTIVVSTPPFPVVSSPLSAMGRVGAPFTYQITATNGPTAYGAAGLPAGLVVDASTGAITGTPAMAGSYLVALSATSHWGAGLATLTLSVSPDGIPEITSPTKAQGRYVPGSSYRSRFLYTIAATNHPTRFDATGLPGGLQIDPSSGVISGYPDGSGESIVAISAGNAQGTGTASLEIDIAGPDDGGGCGSGALSGLILPACALFLHFAGQLRRRR